MRLLKRLLPNQNVDALLGDISEEAPRRSRLWYWSQLLAVLGVGAWRDVRTHKSIALRACAVGFVWLMLRGYAFSGLPGVLTGAGFMWHGGWVGLPWYWHYPYSWSFAATLRVLSTAAAMSPGWIVVRLHRSHGLTMLLAFFGAWMLLIVAIFLWYATLFSLRPDHAALLGWVYQFPVVIQHFMISSLWLLAGGCLATRRTEAA